MDGDPPSTGEEVVQVFKRMAPGNCSVDGGLPGEWDLIRESQPDDDPSEPDPPEVTAKDLLPFYGKMVSDGNAPHDGGLPDTGEKEP